MSYHLLVETVTNFVERDRIRNAFHVECSCEIPREFQEANTKFNAELWEFLRGTYSCGSYGDIWRLKVNGRSLWDFHYRLRPPLYWFYPFEHSLEISIA